MNGVIRQRNPGELKIIKNGEPVIFAEGKIGAIIHFPVLVDEGNGYVERNFEKFVRSPGTRIIAVRDGKIYLQKEIRLEKNNAADWRLPGGKVVDTFKDYKQYFEKSIPKDVILAAAAKELHEEAGLQSQQLELFFKDECGTTVEWDLYYVVARNAVKTEDNADHNEGEDVHDSGWFTFTEVLEKCKSGEISEGRTAAALLRFTQINQ